jgi:predicted DNA-binding protein YlxM (UPF0122 family)
MVNATISADIISSSSLSISEIEGVTCHIYSIFDKIKGYQKDNGQGYTACRLISGDLIEYFIDNPNDALRIALILKAGIKSFTTPPDKDVDKHRKLFETYGVRVAIGVGDMDITFLDKGIWKGDAINQSGRLIADQKTSDKERLVVKNTLFFSSYDNRQTAIFQTIMTLLDVIFSGMTKKQCEILFMKLIGYSEKDIAEELKITQSSVNQRSTGAAWRAFEEALNLYSTFDFQEK